MYPTLLTQFQSLYEPLYMQQLGADSVDVTGEASVTVNGQNYMYFSIVSHFGDTTMHSGAYYLLSTDGGYVVTFTLTYYQAEEEAGMDAFMQGVVYHIGSSIGHLLTQRQARPAFFLCPKQQYPVPRSRIHYGR